MAVGNCPACSHPMAEHTGTMGECRHDYEAHVDKPNRAQQEQCLCIQGRKLVEDKGTTLND